MNIDQQKKIWEFLSYHLQRRSVRRIIYSIILITSLGIVLLTIVNNWNEFKSQDLEFDFRFIILATILYPLGMLPTAASWHQLLRAFGVRTSFRYNLRAYILSSLPRHIPGFVWFVANRSLLYEEIGIPAAITVATTGFETALLALTGFTISIIVLITSSNLLSHYSAIRFGAVFALIVLLLLLFLTPNLNHVIQKIFKRYQIYQIPQFNQTSIGISLIWMFMAWIGGGLLLFILAQAITSLSWVYLPATIGMWGAAGGVSLTIGIGLQGLGLREVTLGALLSTIIPPLPAFVLAVSFRLIITVGEFLWVVLLAWATKYSRNS